MNTDRYLSPAENLARLRELRAALRNRDYVTLDQGVLDTAEAVERLRHERAARAAAAIARAAQEAPTDASEPSELAEVHHLPPRVANGD